MKVLVHMSRDLLLILSTDLRRTTTHRTSSNFQMGGHLSGASWFSKLSMMAKERLSVSRAGWLQKELTIVKHTHLLSRSEAYWPWE